MKGNILFLDTVHPALKEVLTNAGFVCVDGSRMTRNEAGEAVTDATGIVIRSRMILDREILSRGKGKLRFIARAGAGMESIDTVAAGAFNITCLNAPEGNRDAVGEHALGMLLMLINRLKIADAEVRKGLWLREENRGTELKGKSIAIIGFGNMGSAFASKLQGLGMNILVYDKYIVPDAKAFPFITIADMKTIFSEADIVSLHIPLNEETDHLVSSEWIRRFRKNIFLVNTARGRIVDTEALQEGLQCGKLRGACLDVVEYEEHSFEKFNSAQQSPAWDYLIHSDKVVFSPHIAGWTFESHEKISRVLGEKILGLFGNI